MKNASLNLLVEIGTEELPVDALDVIHSELAAKAEQLLRENRLDFSKICVETTPRRIALFIESLAVRQQDHQLEISGPSHEKAYDGDGKPTPILEGFLKSKKASLSEVSIKETLKGRFVLIQRLEKGKLSSAILPELLCQLFTSLNFPKNMRWEPSSFRFPRPIRWIVCLLGNQLIPLKLADVQASRQSFGHRFLAPRAISIVKADWELYQKALKKARVIISFSEREEIIRKGLKQKFKQQHFDEELVHLTANLVEIPVLIQGKFSTSYLELPSEVLASCMKKNQKIFACYDQSGRLMNRFVGVMNGQRKGLPQIIADFENVLESRLRDARYFYDADTKEPLEKKFNLLEQIVYLGKLGSMKQKAERLEKLAGFFAETTRDVAQTDSLKRAAHLCKIDLLTHMVYEFPDLQGIIGRHYALEAGEDKEVASAIGTQYLPKNLSENYQDIKKEFRPLGAMLGIIDRLDLLVGAFGIGLEPTGSQDPFALRRAAGSLVKLIRAFGFHFSLYQIINLNCSLYSFSDQQKEEVCKRLSRFLQERMNFELGLKVGTRAHEIFQAVARSSFDDIADAFKRFEILNHMENADPKTFLQAAKVVERTGNILKGVKEQLPAIDPALFAEPLEKALFQLIKEKSGEISEALKAHHYEKATKLYGHAFSGPLHDFFEKIMINVEDVPLRRNRQALMKQIFSLYADRLADLSVLSRLTQE